mmetsp:Transcript_56858/g.122978  ORF Transcript_56858/g.122978 Transcript_56858/m.122978 type:complete len:341 (-) Transcript_56858:39-1061(-)
MSFRLGIARLRPGVVATCRYSSGSVAVRSAPSPAVAEKSGSVAKKAPQSPAVSSAASSMAAHAESARASIFKGSSSGTAYSADGPLLGTLFGPQPSQPSQPASVSRPSNESGRSEAKAPPPAPIRTEAELKQFPVAELNRMLAARGVSPGAATEKGELAKWVFQHQHLPESAKSGAVGPARRAPLERKHSLAELQQMPAAELRDMLDVRGVGEGSATEKSELAKWVWQHQDLPVLYKPGQKRQGSQSWRWGPGKGRARDVPRDEAEAKKQELLEAGGCPEIEGEGKQALLEGKLEDSPRRRWPWVVAGVIATLCLAAGALAANDARRSASESTAEPGETE